MIFSIAQLHSCTGGYIVRYVHLEDLWVHACDFNMDLCSFMPWHLQHKIYSYQGECRLQKLTSKEAGKKLESMITKSNSSVHLQQGS